GGERRGRAAQRERAVVGLAERGAHVGAERGGAVDGERLQRRVARQRGGAGGRQLQRDGAAEGVVEAQVGAGEAGVGGDGDRVAVVLVAAGAHATQRGAAAGVGGERAQS